MNQIKIAKDLSLPRDIVTQTIAILAKRRAGKSYLMRKIVEGIAGMHDQIVLVDPKGDQWGVRSSADGKKAGLPIVILGGEHGDVPLEANAGELVAKLVVEDRVSVLLDLSMFRKSEVATFMTGFLENLYRLKAKEVYRTPVCLVIDEADAIAPQKPQRGEERMLGAAEDIVRRGGQRGIGTVLVTQRSAVLNKNVLTQAQLMIALRTIAPQDLAAMNAWIDVHGTQQQKKTLMESLPSLPTGDAWFWSPGWPDDEGIFKRVHVLPIETFDSGATPKAGEVRREPKTIADVDLEVLKKQMSSTIEKMKADSPAALKREIVDLKKQLAAKPEPKVIHTGPTKVQRIEVPMVGKRTLEKLVKTLAAMKKIEKHVFDAYKAIEPQVRLVETYMSAFEENLKRIQSPIFSVSNHQPIVPEDIKPGRVIQAPSNIKIVKVTEDTGIEFKPTAPQQKILNALRWLETVGVSPAKKDQLAFLAETKSTSGGYFNNLGVLRSAGMIDYPQPAMAALTPAGRYHAAAQASPLSNAELHEQIKAKVPPAQWKILEVIIEIYPGVISKDELADRIGVPRTSGGYFNNLGSLRTLGLISYPTPKMVAGDKILFLS